MASVQHHQFISLSLSLSLSLSDMIITTLFALLYETSRVSIAWYLLLKLPSCDLITMLQC